MPVKHKTSFIISSDESRSFTDLTQRIEAWVNELGFGSGLLLTRTLHTTTAIFINERESGFLHDLERLLTRLAPSSMAYEHDDFSKREGVEADERVNGFAHLQASLLGSQVALPVVDGKLALGRWQSIIFAELDGPRKERIIECVLFD